ncbi:hypothetical protein BU15DRAFT_72287 [Melanogaster broomeanus]|nr:hypothetical protein BU15DRAFT_72287 [Melanogaster broomeanus]
MTLNSIFDKDDLSETAVDTEQEPATIITTDSPEEPEKASVPPPSKKRGRPRKQTNVPNNQSLAAEDTSEAAPKLRVTYYLAMFSESQMRKPEKQRKSVNTFLSLSSDVDFDTLKAQVLQKICEKLAPKTLAYENYSIEWTIPRIQTAAMSLSSSADYKFLIDHALKQKNPSANVVITSHMCSKKSKQTKCSKGNPSDDGGHDSADGDSEKSDGSDSDNQPVKKKSKERGKLAVVHTTKLMGCLQKRAKGFVETPLNKNINAKIQNLQNRWMCSKPGCSSDHCFVHPEHPEHFPLGHEHLSVWAAAWNKDPTLADLDTPPNHHKFNTLPSKNNAAVSPLLSRRLAERNQVTSGPTSPVINFNIPPELFNSFRPATQAADVRGPTMDNAHPPVTQDQMLLLPPGAQHGAELTLDEFCAKYTLSDGLKEMGFKHGEIAAMKAAVKRWSK